MRWVRDERGATGVFVAVCLVSLIGMTAFTLDFAALYQERRELQNGADAAVLAVAEDCAEGVVDCVESLLTGTAETYADANATDDAATVDSVLPGIDVDGEACGQCVTVNTSTDGSSGSLLAYRFAPVLGCENCDGKTVHASATAVWGAPTSLATLPLAIGECEFDMISGDNTGEYQVITFHDPDEPCDDPVNKDLPGGFGWLDADNCQADVDAGNMASADPGASPGGTGCTPEHFVSMQNQEILVPVFDFVGGTGTNGEYRILGFAAFILEGYSLGGQYTWNLTKAQCAASKRCIAGRFTRFVTSAPGEVGEAPDLGVYLVKLIA
jgi:hypothetical protein